MKYENQTYIKSVKLCGYKSIKDLEVEFLPGMNIIIGENGSGKTNFLEFLEWGIDGVTKGVFFDFMISTTDVELVWRDEQNKPEVIAIFREAKSSFASTGILSNSVESTYSINGKKSYKAILHEPARNEIPVSRVSHSDISTEELFNNKIGKSVYFAFEIPKNIPLLTQAVFFHHKKRNSSNEENGVMNALFSLGLPEILKQILVKSTGLFDIYKPSVSEKNTLLRQLSKELKKVTIIDSVELTPIREVEKLDNVSSQEIHLQFKINNEWYHWKSLSDGTKRMFLIICHLLDSSIKQFFIEEPEIGVHPKQLGKLMTILKEQSQYKQIILTTHSPDVLDVLTINELDRIFVCKLNNEGTKLYKLDEKRRLKAKAYMTEVDYLSSYWRMSDLENVEV